MKRDNSMLLLTITFAMTLFLSVSLTSHNLKKLETITKKYSVTYQVLGKVEGRNLTVKIGDKAVIDTPVKTLSQTWRNSIPSRL